MRTRRLSSEFVVVGVRGVNSHLLQQGSVRSVAQVVVGTNGVSRTY